jgi:hypothetical protein
MEATMHGNAKGMMLRDKYRAAKAAMELQRLLALDDMWTNHLKNAKAVRDADISILEKVSRELDALIAKSAKTAQVLGRVAGDNSQQMDLVWRNILKKGDLRPASLRLFETKMKESGGFSTVMLKKIRAITEKNVGRERKSLSKKVKILRGGGFTS